MDEVIIDNIFNDFFGNNKKDLELFNDDSKNKCKFCNITYTTKCKHTNHHKRCK